MIVLGGTASNGLDISLAKQLGAKLGKVKITRFPDSEIKVKVPEIEDDKVVIVQSTSYPQEKNLFELMLTAYALKKNEVKVCAVIPYLAYARQNMSFEPGEAVSINAVLDMLHTAGVDSLVIVNPHKRESLKHFKGKVCTANAAVSLANGIKRRVKNPFVLAPDKSAMAVAEPAAKVLGCKFTYLEKNRDSKGKVTIKKAHGGDFKGKNVIIFDDMITSGGTIEIAAKYAFGEGAASVSAAAIHLVMVNNAYERLQKIGVKKIFGTNSIPFKNAEIFDISPDVAKCVKDVFKK